MNNKDIAEYIAKTMLEKRLIHEELTVEQAVDYFYGVLKESDRRINTLRPIK